MSIYSDSVVGYVANDLREKFPHERFITGFTHQESSEFSLYPESLEFAVYRNGPEIKYWLSPKKIATILYFPNQKEVMCISMDRRTISQPDLEQLCSHNLRFFPQNGQKYKVRSTSLNEESMPA